VEVGEDEARAARTERTPFRRNLRRPTVPPPSVHMVRPVRNIFTFLFSFLVCIMPQDSCQRSLINLFFIIIVQTDLISLEFGLILFFCPLFGVPVGS
jgi:hypothetical protein